MENFVLNLFSDQLSKIILDFHKSTINANFLSGKGSITNIKLNVDLINDFLNKPPHGTVPFLEFTEITLSELRVEVTSYTNLKKAPIVLVIEEIHAKAREPLEYHVDPAKNALHKNKIAAEKKRKSDSSGSQQTPPKPYGLVNRILDNLSVRIKHIYLSFSSLGKLKTRRSGPWTPPTLKVCFDNVEWICVTETGNADTPENVWAHNESSFQRRGNWNRHRSCTIYKKLSMVCHVKLLPSLWGTDREKGKNNGAKQQSSDCSGQSKQRPLSLLSNTKVDVYLAYVRRLQDACITGADLDVMIHNVDINLDVAATDQKSTLTSGCDLGAFVHMLVGMLHCYYKDRSFVDPFHPDGVTSSNEQGLLRGFNSRGTMMDTSKEKDKPEAGPDDFLPEVAIMEDDLESSDDSEYEEEPDEEHDEAYLAWKRNQNEKQGEAVTPNESTPAEQGQNNELPLAAGEQNDSKVAPESQEQIIGETKPTSPSKEGEVGEVPPKPESYKAKRKAVLVIASGAQQFEKLSFSFSIPRINMKLCFPNETETKSELQPMEGGTAKSEKKGYLPMEKNHHCLELLLEGLVAECIWPKKSGEMGGHIQGSIKYFHLIDSVFQKAWGSESGIDGPKPWNVTKIFPLLRIGTRLFQGHDAFSLSPHLTPTDSNIDDFSKCDEFPYMEDRQVTWSWRRDSQSTRPRALAFKSTISFVDETLTRWSKTNVVHEASLGKVEVVLDSRPFGSLMNVFSNPLNQCNLWFDERWLSGNWHDQIDTSIIAVDFFLKDHLQPLPSLSPTGSKQSALSSELRSVTAHFDAITVRVPNPMDDLSSFRMADIIFSISEATFLVSSDLPRSFLSGRINAENISHEYPHDPSDISCMAEDQSSTSSEQIAKFRMQISLSDCSLKVMPVQAYSLNHDELGFSNLLAPTNVTMMISLDHKNTKPNETDASSGSLSRTLILSVLVHQLESNIELRSIYGALEVMKYHAASVMKESPSSDVEELILTTSTSAEEDLGSISKFSTICIHVPESEVNVWGEQAHATSPLKTNQSTHHGLLCQLKAGQFEFGMEFTKLLSPTDKQTSGTLYKCCLRSFSLEICSQIEDGSAKFKMMEILSMGNESSDSAILVNKVSAFGFPGEKLLLRGMQRGFFLRSETLFAEYTPSTSANAVEFASPLIVDLDLKAIEFFLNVVVESLLAPVFIGSKSHFSQIGQTPLGSALWITSSKICALFSSRQSKLMETEKSDEGGNSLFRLSFYRLLFRVPSVGELEGDSFGLFFRDVEVAVGDSLDTHADQCYRQAVQKHCDYDGQTWLKEFRLLAEETADTNTFYALRSKHSLLRIGHAKQFSTIIPESSIYWSLPLGLGGSSPPADVFAMKDLGFSLMIGAYPLSSLYFKLYKLSPQQSGSAQSEFSLAATRLHSSIGSYHCKMHDIFGRLNAEVNRLREAVFAKENERVGALALASSTAAGWVRVGEDLSFSHRIFSSATFYKYWMVLDRSLLILYNVPGDTKPSFVIPLRRASTELRSLSMSSTSIKSASGIVDNHLQQKGFSVFDSREGNGLFFVTANGGDYIMWTNAISTALKTEQATPPEIVSTVNDLNVNGMISSTDAVDPTPSSVSPNLDPIGVTGDVPTASGPPQVPLSDGSSATQNLVKLDPFEVIGEACASSAPPQVPLDATPPEIFSTANDQDINGMISCTGAVDPTPCSVSPNLDQFRVTGDVPSASGPPQVPLPAASSATQNLVKLDPFEVIGEACASSAPPQVPLDEISAAGPIPFGVVDVTASPVTIARQEISPAPDVSVEDSETMGDEEMDDISLSDSVKPPNDSCTIIENVPSTVNPFDSPAPPASSSDHQKIQNLPVQSLPMRERLALAKGKSKFASSRFGSALKSASESGRGGIKQAVEKETPRKEEPTRSFAVGQKMAMLKRKTNTKLTAARSSMQEQMHVHSSQRTDVPALPSSSSRDELSGNRKLVVGQKMSLLKQNASTKLTAARSSMQEQMHVNSSQRTGAPALPPSSSRDELSGNRKLVVGQKMSLLKQNASTKLTSLNTAVRSTVQDQSSKSIAEISPAQPDLPISSQPGESSVSRSGKNELRKKFSNLDQSVSNTLRSFKIDEKMTQLSAAVKSGVKNDPMMRVSRQRLGIGQESKSIKPIKFNARETFLASSETPLKVKSISSGNALLIDSHLSEKINLLRKINGSWVVTVDAIEYVEAKLVNTAIVNHNLSSPHSIDAPHSQDNIKWKYRIAATDVLCGVNPASVERSSSDMLSFYTKISEIIAQHLPSTAEIFSQEGFRHGDTSSPIFKKLSPIERLRVSGNMLQRVTEINHQEPFFGMAFKVFLSTLLECHMPEEAITATETFLDIDKSKSDSSPVHGSNLTSDVQSVDEAFGLASNVITAEQQPVTSQSKSLNLDPKLDRPYSSLLNVIMEGYTKAMQERDEALASLATTSIINDNQIMQERLAKSNRGPKSPLSKSDSKKHTNDEEDMLTLCKQLGSEIALRTAAESEINRLNERLEFERNIAEVKENELRTSFAQANASSD